MLWLRQCRMLARSGAMTVARDVAAAFLCCLVLGFALGAWVS